LVDDVSAIVKNRFSHIINYSFETLPVNDIWIKPTGLLNETGINHNLEIKIGHAGETPLLFGNQKDDLGFDIFAAVFFCLSRYEEYQSHAKFDKFGRYLHDSSLLHQQKVLHKPVVDYWMRLLRNKLAFHYPALKMDKPQYACLSTLDIDNAYAFRHKSLLRQTIGLLKDAATGKIYNAKMRSQVRAGYIPDPYDTYGYIKNSHAKLGITPLLFFLLARYNRIDNSLPPTSKHYRALIRQCSRFADIGIHTSYHSVTNPDTVETEKQTLENILGTSIEHVRQHYLAAKVPQSFRQFHNAGLLHDYSLGYAGAYGFRAGTSFPFYLYDIASEQVVNILLYSTPVMEVTLQQYLKLSVQDAKTVYTQVIGEVKKSGGVYVGLWHNETLSDKGAWKGWCTVFEHMLETMLP